MERRTDSRCVVLSSRPLRVAIDTRSFDAWARDVSSTGASLSIHAPGDRAAVARSLAEAVMTRTPAELRFLGDELRLDAVLVWETVGAGEEVLAGAKFAAPAADSWETQTLVLREAVRSSERLLLGGIDSRTAHDLKNALVPLQTAMDLMNMGRRDPHFRSWYQMTVRPEVGRVSEFLDRLKEYAPSTNRFEPAVRAV